MEYTTCLSEQLEVVIDDRNSAAAIMQLEQIGNRTYATRNQTTFIFSNLAPQDLP
jgi:hypothetical protein